MKKRLSKKEYRYWRELRKKNNYEDLGNYGIDKRLEEFRKLKEEEQYKKLGILIRENRKKEKEK